MRTWAGASGVGRGGRRQTRPRRALLGVVAALVAATPSAHAAEFAAPNPWIVLRGNLPHPPPIDATTPCFPSEVLRRSPELADANRGELLAAREALARRIEAGAGGDWAGPLEALLLARTANNGDEHRVAINRLRTLARDFPAGRTRVCFQLELGRLELLRGNFPEAAAWARRVESLDDETIASADDRDALRDDATLLLAEALYLTGRRLQAQQIYQTLETSGRERLARAARLRAADLASDAGRPEAALPRYREILSETGAGENSQWAARVGEAAFQSADYASALAWFQRHAQLAGDPVERALAEIRVADSAAMLGKLPESRALLNDLVERSTEPAVRDLARVRVSIPPVGARNAESEIEQLVRATESPNHRVSQYARAELGRAYLARGEMILALEMLTRVAFESPDTRLAPWLDAHLGESIEAVVRQTAAARGCRRVIEVVGWRRDFLLKHSGDPDPFLELGRCYEEAGLPGQAIHLYRALVKKFGLNVGERVSLPLARAALDAGELGVAKASAEARVRDEAGPEWALLLARVQIVEGRERDAFSTLRALLETDLEDDEVGAEALWRFAILGVRLREFEGVRPILASADRWLRPGSPLDEAQRADLQWTRAEAARRAGLLVSARRDYDAAVALLPGGSRRASAEYWLAVLEDDPERERAHYRSGQRTEGGGLWADLAGEEHALSRLRERYGRPRELRE